ncbi:putative quinol monooxygenase, partial [Nocardiopsis lucentensis]|uniref:putative quinol monooxygenase n=1 Tax=Nocardiopsis lucentensis TaxID=53441 RepID=UPI00036A1232
MADQAVALVISIRVSPGRREDFLTGISRNAAAALSDEPGCLRFEVTQDAADPDVFWVYEVFADEEALRAHRRAPHFLAWQEEKAALVVPGSQVDHLGTRVIGGG